MKHSSILPPLDAMQALLAAARTGSFSAAADMLSITHGAVSRRVAMVEQWAGARLFTRHGRGVRLTIEGERLAARIEQAVAMIEDGRVAGESERPLDMVRVGVVHSFARLWLFPNLRALEGDPPDLRIEPEIGHRHMTLSDARIAIRLGQGNWPGVTARPLFTEQLQPVACKEIVDSLGPDPAPERLLDWPLIHDADEENWRLWLASLGLSHERRSSDRIVGGYDLALLAAAAGTGIVLARDPYGLILRESLGLMPVHRHRINSPRSFHIVTRPGNRHDVVERLVNRLIATAGLTIRDHPRSLHDFTGF